MATRRGGVIAGAIAMAAMAFTTPASAGTWQCVTFGRAFSGVQIFGDAARWWGAAAGHYAEGSVPRVGGVLVFKATPEMRVGHVATVSQVVSPREIRVTHANWSPIGGRRGEVERDVSVVDTSDAGDWSRVRVWYAPMGDLGRREYPVFGFIYNAVAAAPAMASALAAIEAMPVELAGL